MPLLTIFAIKFRAENTVWSTLLDCSVKVLNVRATSICFFETWKTGSLGYLPKSLTDYNQNIKYSSYF